MIDMQRGIHTDENRNGVSVSERDNGALHTDTYHSFSFQSETQHDTVRVECKFCVDETTRAELMQRFDTINDGLKAQVRLSLVGIG